MVPVSLPDCTAIKESGRNHGSKLTTFFVFVRDSQGSKARDGKLACGPAARASFSAGDGGEPATPRSEMTGILLDSLDFSTLGLPISPAERIIDDKTLDIASLPTIISTLQLNK
jgi:hypothetical protein